MALTLLLSKPRTSPQSPPLPGTPTGPPGRPLIWRATTWRSSGPRLGKVSTPIPASRSWGSATGGAGRDRPWRRPNRRRAVVGPPASGQQRSRADNHNRRSTAISAVMGPKGRIWHARGHALCIPSLASSFGSPISTARLRHLSISFLSALRSIQSIRAAICRLACQSRGTS
jgi:hypothetical protein